MADGDHAKGAYSDLLTRVGGLLLERAADRLAGREDELGIELVRAFVELRRGVRGA